MKKTYNPISDVRNESVDLTKRLYRSISDVVRILDEQRGRAATVSDLFAPNLEAQRMKFRDYCERLMFFDPIGYGRKGEELLWRKGYYDVVSSAKRLRKGPLWKPAETCHLRSHLQAGIGHYHHLLLRLQLDFKLDLRGIIDFPLLVADNGLKKGKSSTSSKDKQGETEGLDWAHLAVHRCLIYLGDLGRYLADLCPGYHVELPSRYYHQALNWKPEAGMPYNQLGTLAGTKNYALDSAYYYMRCMQCTQSFEGAEGNLAGVLERNAKWLETGSGDTTSTLHHLIARFLYVADICFFDKVAQQGVQKVCEEILLRMNVCLSETHLPEKPVVNDDLDIVREMKQPQYLTDEMLFKMAVMALMCMQHLQEKSSDQVNMMMALTLAVMSQLIEKALERIECVIPPRQSPLLTQLNGHCKRRRRRRRRKGSSVSSDISEDEVEIVSSDSDLSEEELVFDVQSSDSEADIESNNDKQNGIDETKKYNMCVLGDHPSLNNNLTLAHIQFLCEQGFLLQTIKVCCDWLVSNAEVLRLCGQSSKLLISRLVSLLNHLAPIPVTLEKTQDDNTSNSATSIKECNEIPLIEEVCVRGLSALKLAHSSIDWSQMRTQCLTPRQETYIRICKMINLGQELTAQEGANIVYKEKNKWFECSCVEESNDESPREENELGPPQSKGKLMQNMGQLWLRAEVRELETKVKHTTHLPPYLVLDCDALIHHITLVKQLVSSRKFIVLIPSIVVSELDEQKRASRRVRDTIRWLETQFRHGNRFLRAQRSNEHLTLPLIKYPKKKDKEAWLYFQVVECCHYLSLHSVDNTDTNIAKNRDSLVTLLTGSKTLLSPACSNGFSPLGIAKSAGINVEHIETFHSKWKNSSKSHG